MHDRSNGLGGGFAGYGIYPEFSECYAFHLFYDDETAKAQCEALINQRFEIASMSKIPTRKQDNIHDAPLIWRYFVLPRKVPLDESELDEAEYVVRFVLRINSTIPGAYVFSSGKNMGVFKAVGFPEDVGEFYRLEEYEGYCWTAHGRYPTNTPGWWGGAHPFALLDYSVVHNGEISSYDANRRFIEMFGYACTLQTDTEAIAYCPNPSAELPSLPRSTCSGPPTAVSFRCRSRPESSANSWKSSVWSAAPSVSSSRPADSPNRRPMRSWKSRP